LKALLLASAISLAFSLFLTPVYIWAFRKLGWGQFIRADGPQTHLVKHGTPTMGGIVFITGSVVGYFVGKLANQEAPTASALLVIFMMVGLGLVGFADDFIKTHKRRSLGLTGWTKIAGQGVVATIFALLSLQFADPVTGLTPASTAVSIFRDTKFDLVAWADGGWKVVALVIFVLWIYILVASASNGVNIADGLDGLATGSSIMAIGAFAVISFWKFNQACGDVIERVSTCYTTRDPLDLAVIAAAICGGLVGFLWYNTSPAQLYMGDTGSLGLGGALAALAILSRTELLLIPIGGLFVIVTGSVIIQRVYFKLTKGKRIFLMSPLHHHFELKGWAEITVVVRFWIIAGLCVAVGLGAFYLEWIVG
jgi:phospho-N-acetylmuramoyl-pentapeptide-transferase